jgi:hypothetical protein
LRKTSQKTPRKAGQEAGGADHRVLIGEKSPQNGEECVSGKGVGEQAPLALAFKSGRFRFKNNAKNLSHSFTNLHNHG